MNSRAQDRMAEAARYKQLTEDAAALARVRDLTRTQGQAGQLSNERIVQRNRGVRPQFLNDIGGCSENYR